MARLVHTFGSMRKVLQEVFPRVVGAALLAATVVVFVRCSDTSAASDFAEPKAVADGGDGDHVGPTSTDASIGEAGSFNLPRVLVAAHAAPDTFDFRLCFGLSDSADGANPQVVAISPLPDDPKSPMPQANYPGIARGNAAVVDPDLGSSLDQRFVVPYLVNALSLTTHPGTCKAVLQDCGSGISCLKSPADYVKLAAVPGSVFTKSGTTLLAFVPGSSVDAGSSVEMTTLALDGRPSSAMGGQLAQLAPSLGTVTARYGSLDAGLEAGVSLGTAKFGAVSPPNAAALTIPSIAAFGSTGISVAQADAGAAFVLRASLAEIQQASDPARPPDELYLPRATYVFVLVGDPAIPRAFGDGGANSEFGARGLHIVAVRSSAVQPDGGNF